MNEAQAIDPDEAVTCDAQRGRVMHHLKTAGTAGVLGPDLARLCNVPSITKRISELRCDGTEIDTESALIVAGDGTVIACARYVLRAKDAAGATL